MTADAGRAVEIGWTRRLASVVDRARSLSPIAWALLGLVVAAELVHGFRTVAGPAWFGGDLLYHQGLIHQIVRGEGVPGGPYPGLPTYYPPGFHYLIAGVMGTTGLSAIDANRLLTLLWIPVVPIGAFLLTRRVTGRSDVAVLAAVLTAFAGAYDPNARRQWVNSLFQGGHIAYPLYPRDVVFGLMPFGVLAYLHALTAQTRVRLVGGAALAGGLFGVAGLIQIQLLLPLPFAILGATAFVLVRDPARRGAALVALVLTGAIAALLVAPWLVAQVEAIGRNGGLALDTSEQIEPARFGFWSYPRQFGLLIPAAIVGAGVTLLFLRRAEGPRIRADDPGRWRPNGPEAAVLVGLWWAIPFALGVLYSPAWPLEDALRPQRMWLVSSQPMAILAAIGVAVVAEAVVEGRWRRPRWVVPAVAAAVVVMALPATLGTARVVGQAWQIPSYAHLNLETDRVPDFRALYPRDGPRRLVLTYEDWLSLVWYLTGYGVVSVVPPGYAKLAYDPAVFTGHSEVERRADVGGAFRGDHGVTTEIADKYGARSLVLARRDGGWGLLDVPAATAERDELSRIVPENGYDMVDLEPGARLRLPIAPGRYHLEVRLNGGAGAVGPDEGALDLVAVGPAGARGLGRIGVPAIGTLWFVRTADIELRPGETLVLEAVTRARVQSIRGFVVLRGIPAGWDVTVDTPNATVLERR